MTEKTVQTGKVARRSQRAPLNGRNILSVSNKEPGFVYRFVNDIGDRVEIFKERGWELVDAKDVRIGDRRVEGGGVVGSKAQASVDKQGTKAFLMRIKDEWYKEDQAEKAQSIAELEKSMKQSALSNDPLRYGKLEIT